MRQEAKISNKGAAACLYWDLESFLRIRRQSQAAEEGGGRCLSFTCIAAVAGHVLGSEGVIARRQDFEGDMAKKRSGGGMWIS